MLHPSGDWENLGELAGPENVLVLGLVKPENRKHAGKRLSEIAASVGERLDRHRDGPDPLRAATGRHDLFPHGRGQRQAPAPPALDQDRHRRLGARPRKARRAGPSPLLRQLSPHPGQVRPRRGRALARGGRPQDDLRRGRPALDRRPRPDPRGEIMPTWSSSTPRPSATGRPSTGRTRCRPASATCSSTASPSSATASTPGPRPGRIVRGPGYVKEGRITRPHRSFAVGRRPRAFCDGGGRDRGGREGRTGRRGSGRRGSGAGGRSRSTSRAPSPPSRRRNTRPAASVFPLPSSSRGSWCDDEVYQRTTSVCSTRLRVADDRGEVGEEHLERALGVRAGHPEVGVGERLLVSRRALTDRHQVVGDLLAVGVELLALDPDHRELLRDPTRSRPRRRS